MNTFNCHNKCCTFHTQPYTSKENNSKSRHNRKKAGMFIVDPTTDKILLVQSRGKLWGPPKGTMETNETEIECAKREVREETGLNVFINNGTEYTKIRGRSIYYHVKLEETPVFVQQDDIHNDANAICWVHTKCLGECIDNGIISVTHHCRILFSKYFGIDLPDNRIFISKSTCFN